MSPVHSRRVAPLALIVAASLLAGCGGKSEQPAKAEGEHAAATAGDYERGPNRGRMLRDGDFALEMTIFEDGVPPCWRMMSSAIDKPRPVLRVERAESTR